jgi:hypothetical protein
MKKEIIFIQKPGKLLEFYPQYEIGQSFTYEGRHDINNSLEFRSKTYPTYLIVQSKLLQKLISNRTIRVFSHE